MTESWIYELCRPSKPHCMKSHSSMKACSVVTYSYGSLASTGRPSQNSDPPGRPASGRARRRGCIGASPRRQHLRQQEEHALQHDHQREGSRFLLTIIAIADLLGGAARCVRGCRPMHGILLPATDACNKMARLNPQNFRALGPK